MIEPGAFPWRPALAAIALLTLALLTVTLRAGVVAEGRDLMRREHVRLSLRRQSRDLQLSLQQTASDLGSADRAAREGTHGKRGSTRS